MIDAYSTIMHAVVIRRDDGTEFIAHASPAGPVLFHGIKGARSYKRELKPHFRCRVARVQVGIKELVKTKKVPKKKAA